MQPGITLCVFGRLQASLAVLASLG